ncbi:MAG: hypothetical protein ACFCUV_00555 [Rivularia sp. (in: cyanobacteria)]
MNNSNKTIEIEEVIEFLQSAESKQDMLLAKSKISQIYLQTAANLFGKIEEAVKK